ncbi:hypothetical protein N7495_005366 [Penicillium taxi]|uniref:uncharacterized protein n=1 Tax=Penicillium taxi TaxID=168475 RepID=UPI0025452806|nr:uncharacterized protein N7495_005366 [Penicillium taxi]KAJ5893675.1 hypothetical protein N7495_005366 [Penicillium taxi]
MALDNVPSQDGSTSPAPTQSTRPRAYNPAIAKYFPLNFKPELVVHPDPITLYLAFFGKWAWKRYVGQQIMERVENFYIVTNRCVTQEELDAFTTIDSRSLYQKKIGIPVSAFLGTAWNYRKIRKSIFFHPDQTPMQFLRSSASLFRVDPTFRTFMSKIGFNMFFWTFTGSLISLIWGSVNAHDAIVADSRLGAWIEDAFIEERKTMTTSEAIRKRSYIAQQVIHARLNGEPVLAQKVVEALDRGFSYDQGQDGYDNSPTATMPDETYNTSQTASSSSPVYQQQSVPQHIDVRPSSQSDSDATDFFLGGSDNDASPTAKEYRGINSNEYSSGSVWARIRQQTSRPTSQPTAQRQTNVSWSQSDQNLPDQEENAAATNQARFNYERDQEKKQARVEFDRMMEAERNASKDVSERKW